MSFLRGSSNYVWCTTSVLGKGATGAVFQGVNKHTGEAVAVKTFNQLSHMRPHEVQMREFEVLKKVKHENIVKLLAIEEEQDGKGKVIVMELCTGGSLFNILDDPENSDGLNEDEFLSVLEHLTAGMKHLRDNNLVHRDLKPGNIMKFVALDGSTVYKLTDFGAARELEDGQQFVSLYGTEEYLHPDMYERAVLRKPVGKTFGATVDLWSIGVTLYHVATGNLPFRPFGGRRNKETMYYITAKKVSGVISGVQNTENGEIIWSRELPDSCLLSVGLKKIVTPLFAGLLGGEMNFDRFFQEVTAITNRKPVHFFHVNSLHSIRLYLLPTDCSEASRLIEEQTGMTVSSQLILSKTSQWTDQDKFPQSNLENPLFIFNRENNNILYLKEVGSLKCPPFSSTVSVETDASIAKQCCSVGYAVRRRIEEATRSYTLMHASVDALTNWLTNQLQSLSRQNVHCEEQLFSWNRQLHLWSKIHVVTKDLFRLFPYDDNISSNSLENILQLARSHYNDVSNQMTSISPSVKQLCQRVVRDESLAKEWASTNRSFSVLNGICGKSTTYVTRLKDSWQHLLRDRAARVLTYNDEQFHLLERIKMTETFKSLESLFTAECVPTVTNTADLLADWYKMAQAVVLQAEILAKDVSAIDALWVDTLKNQERFQFSYSTKLHELVEAIKRRQNFPTGEILSSAEPRMTAGTADCKYNKNFSQGLKKLQAIQGDVSKLAEENSHMLSRIERLIDVQKPK
ncbi:serine/threonine-protein kinase TBK1-like [Daphnia pulex]|uniref:serine/threonine-protein kinase TBK1-like n=1 Tax=Daphnia pulex TaxID=6669 RepID=UPI001EDEC93A|nr:serine/threonine-protein kinase TBK1-like [Daphnia pulex]